jgi:hypothetical protein
VKQTVEKIVCDECGKEILNNEQCITLNITIRKVPMNAIVKKDFCLNCVTRRINHSIYISPGRIV